MSKEPIKVTLQELKALVESGKTKQEIGKHYSLNMAQTIRLLKEAKLTIKRAKRNVLPAFILETDEAEFSQEVLANVTTVETKKVAKAKKEDDSDLLQVTNKNPDTETNEW